LAPTSDGAQLQALGLIKPHIEPDGSISWTVLVEFELGGDGIERVNE
jgi:hypothetical protein